MKKLKNINLFIVGDPEADEPDRLFFSYDVVSETASKKNQIYEILSFDEKNTIENIWNSSIEVIKRKEGVQ